MTDTPEPVRLARDLAEAIHSAYAQRAAGTLHPQQEQSLLARLAEALRPAVETGSPDDALAAANGALDAWEQAKPGTTGPRITGLDLDRRSVTIARGG